MNMISYAAFFRGINVGGKNSVKMAELRNMFIELGFEDVKTYIQSGNVIFSSDSERSSLSTQIEDTFQKRFGFHSAVIIRSSTELISIVNAKPFSEIEIEQALEENPKIEHLYVYLTDTALDTENIKQVCATYTGKDKIHISKYEIYLLCYKSVRDSELAALFSRFPQTFTARNLKTMNKVVSLIEN